MSGSAARGGMPHELDLLLQENSVTAKYVTRRRCEPTERLKAMTATAAKTDTQTDGPLTPEQIARFHDEGFLIVRGLYTAEDMARIEVWTDEVEAWPETPGKHMMYFEKSLKDGSRVLNRLENFVPYHPGFNDLLRDGRMIGAVSQLLDERAVLFKDKINFKMPGGDGFKAHQDLQAGWERYASYFVSALVCIDEATVENGCLELAEIDSSFHLGNNWEPLSEEQTAGLNFRPAPTKPGDLVFFDSFTPHASAPNMTDRSRRLYYATYNKLSEGDHLAAYFADKYVSFPPDIERDPGKEYVFRV
jgi:ectoine hydroxylase-related dioxygenase (phytanoyl-CoA dioxygenase family)